MVLHTKHRLGLVAQPLDGLVIQINPVHSHLRRQRRRIHCKTVVLRSDFDPTRLQIFHRLVSAPMPKLQLEGLATQRLAQNLMTQANPEDGDARVHQRLHLADNPAQRPRIARTIAQEHPGRLVSKHLRGRSPGRNDADSEPPLAEASQDVVFDAEIVGHDRDVRCPQRKAYVPWVGR